MDEQPSEALGPSPGWLAAAGPALERLVQPLPDVAVLAFDEDARVQGAWGTGLALLGISDPSGAVGSALEDLLPETVARALRSRLALTLEGLPQQYVEGDEPGALRMELLPVRQGPVEGGVVVVTTAPWVVRHAPRIGLEAEALAGLVDALPLVIGHYDRERRIRYVNAEAERATGVAREALIGRLPEELGYPESLLEQWRQAHGRVLETEVAVELRAQVPTPRGTRIFEIRLLPLGKGEDLEVVAIGTDVTERVQAERALAESEQLFRLAFDHSPIGTALVGLDGRLRRVNPALCRLADRDATALTGRHFVELLFPDDRARAEQEGLDVLSGRRETYQVEARLPLPGGEIRWVNLSGALARDDTGRPRYALAHVEDISDRRRTQEALQRRALLDPLTGLANRAYLLQRLGQAVEHARRHDREVAVLFCDLDEFKQVNDHFGHQTGDRVLREVGRRLRRAVRAEDTAARFGGDEFVVLCEDVTERAEVDRLVRRLRNAVSRPVVVAETRLPMGMSVGVAFSGEAGLDPDALLEAADRAMFVQKPAAR